MGGEGTLKRDEGQGLPAGREEGEGRRDEVEDSDRSIWRQGTGLSGKMN